MVALRTMATGVVESEMARLERRLPGLDEATRAELLQTLRRVTDKLVHQPTIRAKELGDRSALVRRRPGRAASPSTRRPSTR